MGYKRITLNTIVCTLIIVFSSLAAGYLTSHKGSPWYLLLLLPVLPAVLTMVNMFNQSNRQIAFFFDAIRNEDSSLKFPGQIRQKSLRHLYQSLNDLNDRINEIKLQNEYLDKYYQSFIRHAATGLMAINPDNEIEIMNEKAFEYAGIPPFTPLHLVPVKIPDLINMLSTIKPGEVLTYNRFTGESQINLLIRSREISYGGKVSRLISLQDIRHELDEKELDAWQKLIRVLTHEIMNSIAPIVSLTATLRKFFTEEGRTVRPSTLDEETIENIVQGLDTIEERGKGLVSFVDSYRKLTRIPEPETEPFPVQEWFDHIRLLMQEQLENRKITMELKTETGVKTLTGDKKLLTQVMINIINNAMEALDEIPENRMIRVSVMITRQNRTLIRVSNNGPLIPPENIGKIFIPFFTTREQGSGIGLSLSRQILRLHHGSLFAESNESLTSFLITL
ncbi:MAG: ATP-binding protein [Bacteroidetes bacterium]|nr:ATP-binding protein [Bacteroidota bacterium]